MRTLTLKPCLPPRLAARPPRRYPLASSQPRALRDGKNTERKERAHQHTTNGAHLLSVRRAALRRVLQPAEAARPDPPAQDLQALPKAHPGREGGKHVRESISQHTVYLVHNFTTERLRNSIVDFIREVHLLTNLVHSIVHLVNIPEPPISGCYQQGSKCAYISPWIAFIELAPIFIACMASRLTDAPSSVITCCSIVIRAPASFSICVSYAFLRFKQRSAAVAFGKCR